MLDVLLIGTAPAVGKTRLAAAFARRELERGRRPGYLRPVQTGRGDDARLVAELAPGTVCATVHRYLAPLAPAVAARLEHAPPATIDHVCDAAEELRAATDGIVVEAGGLLEPLGEGIAYADLAAALGLPVLVVTRPDASALNDVALAVAVAAARRIAVAGIAITGCAPKPDLAERTTRAELARIAPVLESVPLEVALAGG